MGEGLAEVAEAVEVVEIVEFLGAVEVIDGTEVSPREPGLEREIEIPVVVGY